MRIFKPKKNKKIKLNAAQRKAIRSGRTTEQIVRKEIGLKKAGAYCVKKLNSQGLWDCKQKGKLKVMLIADMSEAQKKEYGVV